MKRKSKKPTVLFGLSAGFMGLASFVLVLIPFADFYGTTRQQTTGYIIGLVFWLSMIVAYILFWFTNKFRKKQMAKTKMPLVKQKPGLILFFRNIYGKIADIVCAVSFCGTVAAILLTEKEPGWYVYLIIAVFIFSLQMHGMLNGENFRYIMQKENKFGRK